MNYPIISAKFDLIVQQGLTLVNYNMLKSNQPYNDICSAVVYVFDCDVDDMASNPVNENIYLY